MSKELTTIDYSNENTLRVIRDTVAQESTPSELAMFVNFCKSTGLNPFKKEIWFIKAGGRVQMMTGLNGYLAIANRHPEFEGMEVEVDDDENPTRATCKVWRRDRRFPSTGIALMKEYQKNTPIWKQMPRVMLTKVAKSIALREAFPQELGGLYTAEEMPTEYTHGESRLPEQMQGDIQGENVTVRFKDGNELDAAFDEILEDAKVKAEEKLVKALAEGGEYKLEYGSYRGTELSKITKIPYLENHIKRYSLKLSRLALEELNKRLKQLKYEFAVAKANEQDESDSSPPRSQEEIEEGFAKARAKSDPDYQEQLTEGCSDV